MNFIDQVIQDSISVWNKCANEKFLNQMVDGTLRKEPFKEYIIQDSLYLRDYLKVFAYAIIKSKNLKQMQVFYSALGFVKDGENVTRIHYLKDFGLTDEDVDKALKRSQCKNYCDFLLETASNGDVAEILFAMLPCMLGYNYVFEKLLEREPKVLKGYYGPLVSDYTSENYRQTCTFWRDYTEQICLNFDEKRKQKLNQIFQEASLHEWYFWQMAGEAC